MIFRHKNTLFPHNFRDKPGTSLAIMPVQDSMTYNNFTQKGNDQPLTTPVGMPAILIGTNSTQDVQQDMILLDIMEGMKNE